MNDHDEEAGAKPIPDPDLADISAAVREMAAATAALRTLIQKQYPTRREMEADYVRKETTKRRLALIFSVILVSALVCFVGTVSTVSTCFLGGDDKHPGVCKLLPGYTDATDRQKEFERQFKHMNERLNRVEKEASR